MYATRYCPMCHRDEAYACLCSNADKERYSKLLQLDRAREEVASLERELGVEHKPHGNRAQRRAHAARARKVR